MEIDNITDTINETEREKFISNLDNYSLGKIYDISLYKKLASDKEEEQITELTNELEFEIELIKF